MPAVAYEVITDEEMRVPKLFTDLALARGDGRYARILRTLGSVQLLIIDLCGAHSDVELY